MDISPSASLSPAQPRPEMAIRFFLPRPLTQRHTKHAEHSRATAHVSGMPSRTIYFYVTYILPTYVLGKIGCKVLLSIKLAFHTMPTHPLAQRLRVYLGPIGATLPR